MIVTKVLILLINIKIEDELIEDYINTFIHGRCEEVVVKFPEACIDIILTSPPYADKRNYGIDESKIHPDDYINWFLPKAREFFRILKPTGNFVLNINDNVVKGEQHLYVFELVIALVKEIGFKLVRDYIWYNPSTPPNIFSSGKHGRTKKSHEFCFWFSKTSEWVFNIDSIRKPYGPDMNRYLEGNGRGDREQNLRPSTHSFNCGRIWKNNGGSDPGSVIVIGNTSSNDSFQKLCRLKGVHHPARFPEKLAEFFILSGSNEDGIVLDPFSGSGTTAIAAQRNNRRWIGIDANAEYCDLSQNRLTNEFQ